MPEKEYRVPELVWSRHDNTVRRKIDYAKRKITTESNLPNTDKERPLFLRSERADIYKQIIETKDHQTRRELLEQAHNLDKVSEEFFKNRKQVKVNLDGLGEQISECTRISYGKTDFSKPPIILILGISNGLDGAGEFPFKLALDSKREVIVFGHPEAWYGRTKVTKKFAEAVRNSNHFEPHVAFFKSAISQTVEDDKEIELMGISAGSIIASELLKEESFKKRVNQTNLIVPPGLVNMDFIKKAKGLGREVKRRLLFGEDLSKFSVFSPEKVKRDVEERKIAKDVTKAMYKKLSVEYPWWKNDLTSNTGKKTIVVICDNDGVTNGIDNLGKITQNQSLELHIVEKASHETLSTSPEKILRELDFAA